MQKVGNFRDQLNKNMLETVSKDIVNTQEEVPKTQIAQNSKNLEPPKKYKIPPKISNKDVELDDEKNDDYFVNLQRSENAFSSEKNSRDIKEAMKINSIIHQENTTQNQDSNSNEKNISFSEENCKSEVCSEYKESKNLESPANSEHSSIDNKKQISSNLDTNMNPDFFNSSSKIDNDNNLPREVSQTKVHLNTTSECNKNDLNNMPSKSKLNSSTHSQQSVEVSRLKQNKINKPLTEISSLKETNDDVKKNTNLNDLPTNNLLSSTHENEIENFTELMRKLELLKNEIRELRNNKILIQTNYEAEHNKNKIYLNEIEQLRKNINVMKVKEIKEGEAMLKLEIHSLNDNISYHKKANSLLIKENESLKHEVITLQEYISEIMEMKKIKTEAHSHHRYEIPTEIENELNEPLLQNEEQLIEEYSEDFDKEVKDSILPLEPFEEEPRELIDVENVEDIEIECEEQNPEEIIQESNEHNEVYSDVIESETFLYDVLETKQDQNQNYSFEMNNREEEQIEDNSNFKDNVISYNNQQTDQNNLWDVEPTESAVLMKSEKISKDPFEDIDSKPNQETIFKMKKNDVGIFTEKKQSNAPDNNQKSKNIPTAEKIVFNTPQHKIEQNLFDFPNEEADDVFSEMSKDSSRSVPLKKIENANIPKKVNPRIVRPQPAFQRSQDSFAQVTKDNKKANMFNPHFNADEDVGSIFGASTSNENKGNSLFD